MGAYTDAYRRSITDRVGFWLDAAHSIDWGQIPQRALDESAAPLYRWFPDGRLNVCHNALDRHVDAGRGDDDALIYDSPITDVIRTYSYRQLRDEVALAAGMLASLGVGVGDRVLIYMSMTPEAVIVMLACARLGAVHSVAFGGFGARELTARMDDARPVVVVASSCGIEPDRIVAYQPMLSAAIADAVHKPAHCVIVQRDEHRAELVPGRDVDWDEVMSAAEPVGCVEVAATDPLYILYTSGTTGTPKGVVRDSGSYAVALSWSMRNIFDTGPGDVFWAESDVGWVVGHSYIAYGPLLVGATALLYEGQPVGTPDAGAFWRVASQHRVTTMFTTPTAARSIRNEDPDGLMLVNHDLSRLRALFLTGERLDLELHSWLTDLLGVPAIDSLLQTETGWPITTSPQGLEKRPTKPDSTSVPMPGYDLKVLDAAGRQQAAGQDGSLVLKLPLPPGCLTTLWNDDKGYVESYLSEFSGYYATGDSGRVDEDGYVFVTGRADNVLNVAGHRLSSGAIEQVISRHPAVAECVVIGVTDPIRGQTPRALVVLKDGVDVDPSDLEAEIVAMVRDQMGPVAALKTVRVLAALPT